MLTLDWSTSITALISGIISGLPTWYFTRRYYSRANQRALTPEESHLK